MELNKFLEKYLPDYDNKKKDWEKSINMDADKYVIGNEVNSSFCDWYFFEALQNFTNEICKDQRMLCCDAVEYCEYGYELKVCENAKQPEIE